MHFLSVEEVAERLGMSTSKVWALVHADPTFPRPVRLSARMTRWVAEEVTIYQIKQLAKRDGITADKLDGYIRDKLAQEVA